MIKDTYRKLELKGGTKIQVFSNMLQVLRLPFLIVSPAKSIHPPDFRSDSKSVSHLSLLPARPIIGLRRGRDESESLAESL